MKRAVPAAVLLSENFAQGLGLDAGEFAKLALTAKEPVDLGVRCTVFMNSKVKQAQKDGAAIAILQPGWLFPLLKCCFIKLFVA